LRSTIKLTLRHGEEPQGNQHQGKTLDLDNLPNDLAEKGYGIIRESMVKLQ
jgi:hypothetical protein